MLNVSATPKHNNNMDFDLLPMPLPTAANREFEVKLMETASKETTEKISSNGNRYILKHRSFSPANDQYMILLLAKTETPNAFWVPEDEVLLLTVA
jgi:hypothetical protein